MNWYIEVLKKYAQFDGRARRMEYWMYALFNALISIALLAIAVAIVTFLGGPITKGANDFSPLAAARVMLPFAPVCIYGFAVFIPGLAVTVRRLHDTGKSAWWLLIAFVPGVGGIIMLIFTFLDSDPGMNQYGPNPKDARTQVPMYMPPPAY